MCVLCVFVDDIILVGACQHSLTVACLHWAVPWMFVGYSHSEAVALLVDQLVVTHGQWNDHQTV